MTASTIPSVPQTDVAIIGAGPAGLATAIRLGQHGKHRVTIVDRQNFPRDKTCGSAISPSGLEILKRLGTYGAVASHAHLIDSICLHLPRRRQLRIASKKPQILVCSRRVFDQLLLDRALALGAVFIPNFHVKELLSEGGRIVGVRAADGREIEARQTVVANGVHSKLAPVRKGRRLISTIMGRWETPPSPHGELEFVYDRALRPLYGWRFPESPTCVNIGICYHDPDGRLNARALFSEFLERHYKDFVATARQIGPLKGQPLSPSFKIGKLTSPGRIVVGEAGRIVDPASGEGIYQALHSGLLAGDALHEILDGRTDSAIALQKYEAACREVFNSQFRLARLVRGFIALGGVEVLSRVLPQTMAREWTGGHRRV
jgi:flavin-dependent dehydrogenase